MEEVVATMNNVRFLLVWKDTYVFTGGYTNAGWLLRAMYPKMSSILRCGLVTSI